MSSPGFTRSDLRSIRAAAGKAVPADATRHSPSAGCYPVVDDDPLAPLTRDAARIVVRARSKSRRRDWQDQLSRVCLTLIPAVTGTRRCRIEISRDSRGLPSGWPGHVAYHRTRDLMNAVLTDISRASGNPVHPPGLGGARLVTGHRGQRTGAGR